MKIRLALITAAAAFVVTLSSCGSDDTAAGSAPDDLAYSEPTTTALELIESEPEVDLSSDELDLVTFEANWVCELQRRTFASEEAIDQALEEKLAGLGLSRADYDEFRAEVNESQDLRDSILFSFQENCRP